MTETPTTGHDVPDDADESQVPDADHVEDRHDYPDPAFDDDPYAALLEQPLDDEGELEHELEPEDPAMLEADEQIDPEEHDDAIPPGAAPR